MIPSSLAPERVIVFEIAGTVANFLKAVARIRGLEFMAELGTMRNSPPMRTSPCRTDAREGKGRTGRTNPFPAVSILQCPICRPLRELLKPLGSLAAGRGMDRGFAPFAHLFAQLRDLRPWGPRTAFPMKPSRSGASRATSIRASLRTEVELWYRENENTRTAASRNLARDGQASGGDVVHQQ